MRVNGVKILGRVSVDRVEVSDRLGTNRGRDQSPSGGQPRVRLHKEGRKVYHVLRGNNVFGPVIAEDVEVLLGGLAAERNGL